MLKRKVYEKLVHWKKNKGKECLLIKGARQIGKTYIVRLFGKNEYENFVELNFIKNPEYKNIFSGDLSANEIYKRMSLLVPEAKIKERKTLIFLDEIQNCAKARTAIKFLAEDNRCDVISSGSLLGLHYRQDADREVEEIESIPVGYESQITMYSLDFEEFLWANGYNEATIDVLREYYEKKEKVPAPVNEKFQQLFREFAMVGGMPEVVDEYVKNYDFTQAQKIQNKILAAYDDDISKHAVGAEKIKVRACYESLPRQLARENKKFKYSEVEKKATSRKYGDSITWLNDANIVHMCFNVTEPYLPLMANEKEKEFKLYANDTGLLMARYGAETKLAFAKKELRGNAKGGIYENLISEALIKNGYTLHYYKTQDSTMELEFVIEKNGGVVPVEVKAGNTATPSMNSFISKFKPKEAYKFVDGNIGISEDGKITLPHYMAMFL